MSEQSEDRYFMIVGHEEVRIMDEMTGDPIESVTGPDRLLKAVALLAELNGPAEEPAGPEWRVGTSIRNTKPVTPAAFLAETLPAVARRQRLEAHLAEVREMEDAFVRVLAEDAANLRRATALRKKLEKELTAGAALYRPQPY